MEERLLWVLAEQQQMLSASFYWVGTEAEIKGIYPTYYYSYNEIIPIDRTDTNGESTGFSCLRNSDRTL